MKNATATWSVLTQQGMVALTEAEWFAIWVMRGSSLANEGLPDWLDQACASLRHREFVVFTNFTRFQADGIWLKEETAWALSSRGFALLGNADVRDHAEHVYRSFRTDTQLASCAHVMARMLLEREWNQIVPLRASTCRCCGDCQALEGSAHTPDCPFEMLLRKAGLR